ncbi:MAG: hypothetical protein J4G04_02855, partial [Nitrosopumilaceae archaeon]|nr:hypothetical protein [Nitrosopumilaceae archaeon]
MEPDTAPSESPWGSMPKDTKAVEFPSKPSSKTDPLQSPLLEQEKNLELQASTVSVTTMSKEIAESEDQINTRLLERIAKLQSRIDQLNRAPPREPEPDPEMLAQVDALQSKIQELESAKAE